MLLSELRTPDDIATRATVPQREPECNVRGVVLDRHVWMGGWICKRCGARKRTVLTPRVKGK